MPYSIFVNLCGVRRYTSGLTTLGCHVGTVIRRRTDEQVIWINTAGDIAPVANQQTFGNVANEVTVRNAVRFDRFAIEPEMRMTGTS